MPDHIPLTELYLIRHAETVMNTTPYLVGGRSNYSPLTPRGVEQAKRLGRAMLAKQILPTEVFTSPALRTIDTARYSLAEMKLDIEPLAYDDLQELSQGPQRVNYVPKYILTKSYAPSPYLAKILNLMAANQ